jgi:hypothetical protein
MTAVTGTIADGGTTTLTTTWGTLGDRANGAEKIVTLQAGSWAGTVTMYHSVDAGTTYIATEDILGDAVAITANKSVIVSLPLSALVRFVHDGTGTPVGIKYYIGD